MEKVKAVIINQEKCSGCKQCQLICSFAKDSSFDPRKSRIKVLERDREGFFPQICLNCQEPPCLDACPAGAIVRRDEDGYVVLLEHKCIGCNMCIMVCPFNAIGQGETGSYKCDTCHHLEKCAGICREGAVQFIDLAKELSKKRRNLANRLLGKMQKI